MHPIRAGRETMLSFLEVKLGILTSPPLVKPPQRNTAKAHHFPFGIYQMCFGPFCSNHISQKIQGYVTVRQINPGNKEEKTCQTMSF